jgi:branched-chain amino acid aminotransferase
VQVAWISEVDKRKIGSGQIGSITEMIQNLFFKIVTGEEKEYMKWLVSVY